MVRRSGQVAENFPRRSVFDAGGHLYLLSPREGIAKLRANLGNRVPITRYEAALFLGLIGTDEAIGILIERAGGLPESGGHEAACALAMIEDPHTKQVASEWAARNDRYEDAEGKEVEIRGRKIRVWTGDELLRASLRESITGYSERVNRRYGMFIRKWV